MTNWILTTTQPLPTLNLRLRWYKMTAERRKWERFFALAKMANRIPDASGPRNVKISRYVGGRNRIMDYDNMVGGCKPVVDAMVMTKVLSNDDRQSVRVEYEQERITGSTHVVFEVSDVV